MSPDHDAESRRRSMNGLFRRFLTRRDGATAIEFALLALPFFIIVFASLETLLAFSAEQLFANANETMARRIRTGIITATNTDRVAYREAFCEEIKLLMPCSDTEAQTEDRLFIHVESFASYADITPAVAIVEDNLDTAAFKFAPGGRKSINIVRAYYRWDIITDVVRPLLSNVTAADGSTRNYLMVATTIVQTEDYK
jgi:Flp pilus assembly protein TadG